MNFLTVNGKFKTEAAAIKNVLRNATKIPKVTGRYPVCVKTKISTMTLVFGIQYWSAAMINAGESKNTDGTISYYCATIKQ